MEPKLMILPLPANPHPAVPSALPDAAALALRAVHRAMAELRRGTPVLLRGGDQSLVLAAAETVGARGLAELAALARTPPVLLLAATRAAAVAVDAAPVLTVVPAFDAMASNPVEIVVALRLPLALLDPAVLRSLADPTLQRLLPEGVDPGMPEGPFQGTPRGMPKGPAPGGEPGGGADEQRLDRLPVPALGAAALALAKLGRLLPAVVAAPARDVAAAMPAIGLGKPRRLDLLTVEAADILAYPAGAATSLRQVASAVVPLEGAPDARIVAFRAADGGIEHLAIVIGRPEATAAEAMAPLCRVHSECFTGDLLGSLRCDCGPQLRGAIARMGAEGAGVLLYLAQEGRGIGLVNKLRAYTLQDLGLDTLDANQALGWGADERNFLVAATMLEQLGIGRVRLLTNNPEKVAALTACGITVDRREAHSFAPNGVNDHYLDTKARRFGHLLA